eukprot:7673798-Pyramimonas_sp.AAC.1
MLRCFATSDLRVPTPCLRSASAARQGRNNLEHRLPDPHPNQRGLGPTGRCIPLGGDIGRLLRVSK